MPACAHCWRGHRSCPGKAVSSPCRECRPRGCDGWRTNMIRGFITSPLLFPKSLMKDHLLMIVGASPLARVEPQFCDSNKWEIDFISSTKGHIHSDFEQLGWDPHTASSQLDTVIRRNFVAKLTTRSGSSEIFDMAMLVGGYAFCLCSMISITESVHTQVDGHSANNFWTNYNLGANFRCILYDRLGGLIEQVIGAIRFNTLGIVEHATEVYAAAVILHCEISNLHSQLRNALRGLIPEKLPSELLPYLAAVETELLDHIKEGCGRHDWRNTIKGSLKNFSHHHKAETLVVSIKLFQNMSSLNLYDVVSNPGTPSLCSNSESPHSSSGLTPSPAWDSTFPQSFHYVKEVTSLTPLDRGTNQSMASSMLHDWSPDPSLHGLQDVSKGSRTSVSLIQPPDWNDDILEGFDTEDTATFATPFENGKPQDPSSYLSADYTLDGQVLDHFFEDTDFNQFLEGDVSMASYDSRGSVSDSWMTSPSRF